MATRRRRKAQTAIRITSPAFPRMCPFRPARITPKPFVQGPQTAMVVGKSADQDCDRRPGRRRRRRGDLGGQVGPGAGPVPLGPGQGDLLLGTGFAGLGRPGMGHDQHPPRRPGSDRELPGRRPGSAHHHRACVQRRCEVVPYTLPDNGTRTTFKTRSTPGWRRRQLQRAAL